MSRASRSAVAAATVFLTVPLLACGSGSGSDQAAAAETAGAPAAGPAGQDGPQEGPGRGMAWVILGADTVFAEVAATPEERRDGLMYREALEAGTGMLFVFPDEDVRSFWMSNTFIPLDIAFIDSGSRVVDIKQMEPEDTNLTQSDAPAMYALEVPQGWFASEGIEIGVQARIVFGPR